MTENSNKVPLTIVIPIRNEAANLPHCLNQLGEFAEVWVVDSGSTDNSLEIARQYEAKVLQFKWNGRFPKKRNWCLRNYHFSTEWVLFLDADEYLTPEFRKEITQAINDKQFNGYWVNYNNHFMGRLLKHGDKLVKLPLLRIGHGEFERIDEDLWSSLDMEVHEHLLIDGYVGHIKAPIIHNDFKGLTAYFDRHNQYASWEAARYLALKESDRLKFTWEQKIKYRLIESIFFPPLYFVAAYLLKLGFLDGKAGLHCAISKAFYFYQIKLKIAEKKANSSPNTQENFANVD